MYGLGAQVTHSYVLLFSFPEVLMVKHIIDIATTKIGAQEPSTHKAHEGKHHTKQKRNTNHTAKGASRHHAKLVWQSPLPDVANGECNVHNCKHDGPLLAQRNKHMCKKIMTNRLTYVGK